ncbi:hypothetical protein [Pseudomonas fluorescens]|uniref:N-acetyltransferase domain-containing protein n=1 Tax=Pseudomonas fluorescens TaxID=294 RepID=A0A5E7TGW5_PSEFL|nr:hypothetical protein [Pseudomonas fluorescens]VVP95003.1 hypothetical protein PS928_02021 [Pseudomonas fluorescens]
MSAPTAGKAASLELTAPEKLKDIHQLSAFDCGDLLRDAIIRTIAAASEVGTTALVVHPLNERLVTLYEKAGVIRSPQLSPITMMLPPA